MSSPLKRKLDDNATAPSKKPALAKPSPQLTAFFKPVGPKKSGPGVGAGAAADGAPEQADFDKVAWAAKSLTAEQRDLLQLEIETLEASWFRELREHLRSPDFLALKKFLRDEHRAGKTIFPPAPDVYAWSRHTPVGKVKVVILGQDPYHNHNQAHGLSFSVRPPTPAPPSLVNMYKALKVDYPQFSPPAGRSGHLLGWADQGVLLLNACLTVRAHQANSHSNKGWEGFTQKVIDVVSQKRKSGVVFLAWGSYAQKRCDRVRDTLKKENAAGRHLILKSVHPSPLSAHKGFFECHHFKLSNEWLASRYGPENVIDWNLTPGGPRCGPPEKDADVAPVTTTTTTTTEKPEPESPDAIASKGTNTKEEEDVTAAAAAAGTSSPAPPTDKDGSKPAEPASSPVLPKAVPGASSLADTEDLDDLFDSDDNDELEKVASEL